MDSTVLDLFAGTGAIGMEALSRGAAEATFVDRSGAAVASIRDNLDRTRLADAAKAVSSGVEGFLAAGPPTPGPPVDLVFLDPPYDIAGEELSGLLHVLETRWLNGRAGWKVCLTRSARSSTVVVPIGWVVARRLEYGDNLVICYRREE